MMRILPVLDHVELGHARSETGLIYKIMVRVSVLVAPDSE